MLFTNPEIDLMLKIIIPYPAEVAYQNYSKYYLNLNFLVFLKMSYQTLNMGSGILN